MLLAQIPLSGATLASAADSAESLIPIGQVLGWVVNLAIAEIVIRRRRAHTAVARDSPVLLTASPVNALPDNKEKL